MMFKVIMADGTTHIARKLTVSGEKLDGYTRLGIDLWDGCYVSVKERDVIAILFIGMELDYNK